MLTMEPQLEPATLTRLFMQFLNSYNIVHYVSNRTLWIVSLSPSVYIKRMIVLTGENITSVEVLTHNA